jgi:methyl-accepting chemotaxis protein
VKNGDTYIGPIIIDQLNNEPLMLIAVPAVNIFGDFKGVLVSEVNLKFMWDLVGGMKIGKQGQAYVVDKKGDLIAYGDIGRILARENLTRISEVNRFVNSIRPTTDNKINISKGILDTNVVATYYPLETPDWAVVIELPVMEAYDFIIQILLRALMGLVFSSALTIAAGFYFSKRISKPIVDLRNAAVQISEGRLDTRININSGDEIEQLALAFNQMTSQLQQSYQILETKVNERTKELAEAKKKLEDVNYNLEEKVKERTSELENLKNSLEKMVSERTEELKQKVGELEQINKLMVGRELKMMELKEEIERLKKPMV